MIRLDELPREPNVDAHAEDVAVVERVRVRVEDFVGGDAGAGAVDVGEAACGLGFNGGESGGGGWTCGWCGC